MDGKMWQMMVNGWLLAEVPFAAATYRSIMSLSLTLPLLHQPSNAPLGEHNGWLIRERVNDESIPGLEA